MATPTLSPGSPRSSPRRTRRSQAAVHRAQRVYHNGIVKRPSTSEEEEGPERLLGPTKKVGGETFLTGSRTTCSRSPDEEMNAPFKLWKKTLATYNERSRDRVSPAGSSATTTPSTSSTTDDLKIEVLGPLVDRGGGKPA